MSFNLDWIALKGRRKAIVLEELGLEEVGEASDVMNAPFSCAKLASGWLIIAATDRSFDVEKALAAVSSDGFAVGCEMSETVMFSRALAFEGGRQLWAVTHDPDKDVGGVNVEGRPPAQVGDIRRGLEARQAADKTGGVDFIFDVPIELVASICGFRPDNGPAVEWTVLRKKQAAKGGTEKRRKSLGPQIKSQFVHLLSSLEWEETKSRPDQFPDGDRLPYEFYRLTRGLTQVMWFNYGWDDRHIAGDTPYFSVGFCVKGVDALGTPQLVLSGRAGPPYEHVPFWKEVLAIFGKAPPPRNHLIPEVLEQARQHILAADAFLKTGVHHPHVRVYSGLAKDSWPVLPEGVEHTSAT